MAWSLSATIPSRHSHTDIIPPCRMKEAAAAVVGDINFGKRQKDHHCMRAIVDHGHASDSMCRGEKRARAGPSAFGSAFPLSRMGVFCLSPAAARIVFD